MPKTSKESREDMRVFIGHGCGAYHKEILKAAADGTDDDDLIIFGGEGTARVWVRRADGGTWPDGARVNLQERLFFSESTDGDTNDDDVEDATEDWNPFKDDPDPLNHWYGEAKKFIMLVEDAQYRLKPNQEGFVAVAHYYRHPDK